MVYTFRREQRESMRCFERLDGKVTSVAVDHRCGQVIDHQLPAAERQMETGVISRKIERGCHTTRHWRDYSNQRADLYIMDTPGFSTLDIPLEKGRSVVVLSEFEEYEPQTVAGGLQSYH